MMSKEIAVIGIEDVQKTLEQIAPRHARNLMRATIQGMASEAAKMARKEAPDDYGTLKKAIKAKRKKSPPDKPTSRVMVEHGKDAKHNAYYWHFLEHGTKGGIKEHGFIRSAKEWLEANKVKIAREQFAKKLEQAIRRQKKKR